MLRINKSFPNTPWMSLGFGVTLSTGETSEGMEGKMVRIHAKSDSEIRLETQTDSTVSLAAGETEYFYMTTTDEIFVISGEVNVMR